MEIARPQVSEKPPIPAKPRLRPAPPRPPKPSISAPSTVSPASSSKVSPTSSSKVSPNSSSKVSPNSSSKVSPNSSSKVSPNSSSKVSPNSSSKVSPNSSSKVSPNSSSKVSPNSSSKVSPNSSSKVSPNSSSKVSPTSSSKVSPTSSLAQINNDKNQSKKSYPLPNGSLSPKHAISVRTTSAELLPPPSKNVSPRSPDLPKFQPSSEQRKRHMAPSSSSSLPASFRNKHLNKSDINSTPLGLTSLVPFASSSPIIPTSSQRSPIRHVSPPRKVSSATSLKSINSLTIQSPESTTSGVAHNTVRFKEEEEQFSSDGVQPLSINITTEEGSAHLETHTNTKVNTKVNPLRKLSAPPPQRPISTPNRPNSPTNRPNSPTNRPNSPTNRPNSPTNIPNSPPERPTSPPERPTSPPERPTSPPERPTSPPERPTSPPERPNSPPSRPAPCVGRPAHSPTKTSLHTASVKSSENLSIQPKEDVKSTDTGSPVEAKQAVPPPLPKNPPRGGVPRKPRQTTPSSDKQLLDQPSPEGPDIAHDIGGTTKPSEVTSEDVTQQVEVHSNSQLSVHESQSEDSKQLTEIIGSDTSDIETRLQSSESNISVNYSNKSETRTPPKPRPRARPSLTSPINKEGIGQLLSNIDINNKSDIRNLKKNSIAEAEAGRANEPTPELDYAEVYHEDSESRTSSDIKTNTIDTQSNIPQTSDQQGISIHQPAEKAIKNNSLECEHLVEDINTSHSQDSVVTSATPSPQHADVNKSQSTQGIDDINSDSAFTSDQTSGSLSNNNLSNTLVDSKSLLQEEPEATCGMLKEIEELLKTKLGGIELDFENSSTKYSKIKSHHLGDSERNSFDETGTSYENNDFGVKSDDSSVTSPVRPPRPKRQASIVKRLGSQESLNTSSTECLVSAGLSETTDSGNKRVIPRKPKRSFAPRVSRSHSDVTGMKSLVDANNPLEESEQPPQEEAKPFLPPRLESLKRSESATSCQSPPPLPPRNQPRSASRKEIVGPESELPALPVRSSLRKQKSHCKTEPSAEHLKHSRPSEAVPQSGSSASQSKVSSSSRPRPARVAPPPPPGSPRRSATFSPGDSIQPQPSHSFEKVDPGEATKAPSSSRVSRSNSECGQRLSSEVDDPCYHEISDSIKMSEDSKENDETPPPLLPPRTGKSDPEADKTPSIGDTTVQKSVKLSGDSAKYLPAAMSESPKLDKSEGEVKTSSPKEQKQLEKMAKNALIQKVAQGLGLKKSLKMPKVPEITLVVNETKIVPSDDSESETVSVSSTEAVLPTGNNQTSDITKETSDVITETSDVITETSDVITETGDVTTENADELNHKLVPPADNSDAAVPVFHRPLSEVSQQSTSSEPEGSSQNMEEIVSSGTDTEPEEDEEEIYAIRKAKKVFFIANEIASSESTFVDVLKLLNIDFRQHISRSTENLGHTVIPSETLNKILDYLPQLQNFNEELLKDLQERIENWETNPRLADIFVKKGPFLKLYSSYIRNFESATAFLEDAVKKNAVFASTLKEFELSPRCAKLALKHYMLKPIQRIPQYKLLLQDYMKHLTAGSLDYKDTVTALNIVSEVADHANDSMRHGDNVQKLLEIQRSLIGQFEVIQPGRVLLKQGELQKLSRKEMQPRMFMLFNDVLLYTTPTTSGYKINNILPLTGMKINSPKLEDYKYEFNIISVQRSFTLSGSTSEEKGQWVTALQTAIEENAKKSHTFQTVKHGPQTSLLDKDFVLGQKAPLWVPDARVTMCMLCLLEFTLTWRRHHCRSCGRVVCSHCSENKAPLGYLMYQPARVCDKCYKTLKENVTSEYQQNLGTKKRSTSYQSEEDSFTSVSDCTDETADSVDGEDTISEPVKHDSGLSLVHLMSRFQKIRISNREKRKPNNFRPSVLKEVSANDEGSDISGYLRAYKSRRWKRLWFVVKGKVLYTYKASEDMAATESMPLLGYVVTQMSAGFEGAEAHLLFELTHQNNQPLTLRKSSDKDSPKVLPGTTQRLIFRTDSAEATTKWVAVLREASLTYQ